MVGGISLKLADFCEKERKLYLLNEWDGENNLPYNPENITHCSRIKVWWKCEKGHSWQTQLRSRSLSLTGCPKCFEEELSKRKNNN